MDVLKLITLILSIIGTCGTVYVLIRDFIVQHANLEIQISSYDQRDNTVVMYISVVNKSRLPITITSIDAKFNGRFVTCTKAPALVNEISRGSDTTQIFSSSFPIFLSALQGELVLVRFTNVFENAISHLHLVPIQAFTNRNYVYECEVPLTQEHSVINLGKRISRS